MQAYEPGTHEDTLAEIHQHFGFVPAFFAPAQETAEILEHLWQHMQFAYIHNPLPLLFKEQLFTYFSRYCRVPYALICHSCMLYSMGMTSQEVLALLEVPTPTTSEIEQYLTFLTSGSSSFTVWPDAGTPLGKALFFCAIFILLKPEQEVTERCQQEVRRLIGVHNYNYLGMLFSFMKTCQTWIETHSEILQESDAHIQEQLTALVVEEPRLANFFRTYYQRVRREQQSLSERLAEKLRESEELKESLRGTLDALLRMAEIVVQVPGHTNSASESPSETMTTPWIVSAPDQQLVDLICHIMSCRRVGVVTIDPVTERLHPVAGAWLSAEQKQQWWTDIQQARLSDYFSSKVIGRFHADKVFIYDVNKQLSSEQSPYDLQTVLFVPMLIREQLIGVLGLEHHHIGHRYTPEEITLAKAVAKLVALVIERERLLHERAAAQASELTVREINRRMDEFLSIASHELKTPLTSIITNIQLAQRRLQKLSFQEETPVKELTNKLDAVQELLTSADRQVWRLNRLVDELLDVSRIQANKLELHLAQHDLTALVCEVVEQQRQITPKRTISLQLPANQPLPMTTDPDRMQQVIMNYLSNALKYSDCEQPIEVSLQLDTEKQIACVLVHDHGPGLPLSEQEHIWDRFYRVQGIEVQSGANIGLGLGLHICKRIIEHHAGCVGVESTPGQGSTFWFSLPLLK